MTPTQMNVYWFIMTLASSQCDARPGPIQTKSGTAVKMQVFLLYFRLDEDELVSLFF